MKKTAVLLIACLFIGFSTASCSFLTGHFRNAHEESPAAGGGAMTGSPMPTYSADDDDEVSIVYTAGYSTLLNPDLSLTGGLTTYTIADTYGYTYTVPIIDGSDVDSGEGYVDALYDSSDLYYEIADGIGYQPDTYMKNYANYLTDYFASNSSYTSCTISDIYLTADKAVALLVTHYEYNEEPYYDIMGVVKTISTDFIYFDFIYREDCTTGDLLTQIKTILGYTGVW